MQLTRSDHPIPNLNTRFHYLFSSIPSVRVHSVKAVAQRMLTMAGKRCSPAKAAAFLAARDAAGWESQDSGTTIIFNSCARCRYPRAYLFQVLRQICDPATARFCTAVTVPDHSGIMTAQKQRALVRKTGLAAPVLPNRG